MKKNSHINTYYSDRKSSEETINKCVFVYRHVSSRLHLHLLLLLVFQNSWSCQKQSRIHVRGEEMWIYWYHWCCDLQDCDLQEHLLWLRVLFHPSPAFPGHPLHIKHRQTNTHQCRFQVGDPLCVTKKGKPVQVYLLVTQPWNRGMETWSGPTETGSSLWPEATTEFPAYQKHKAGFCHCFTQHKGQSHFWKVKKSIVI